MRWLGGSLVATRICDAEELPIGSVRSHSCNSSPIGENAGQNQASAARVVTSFRGGFLREVPRVAHEPHINHTLENTVTQEKPPIRLKPRLKIIDGQITTTSLDVAEKFGKEHHNVLKAIRNLGCSKEFAKVNFDLVMETMTYTDAKGELVTKATSRVGHVRMTHDGFPLLNMGFTGKGVGR